MSGMEINPEVLLRALAMYEGATERIDRCQREIKEAGRERSIALGLMHDIGMSYSEIAKQVGMSAPRVGQMITALRDE